MVAERSPRHVEPPALAPSDTSPLGPSLPLRTYEPRLSRTWWLRNRRYFLFIVRELTALPIALWAISLLIETARLAGGPAGVAGVGAGPDSGYRAFASPWYVAFSVICLVFALLHSITWLGMSGLILRLPLGEKDVDPQIVTGANFALWALASAVVGVLLVLLGR